MDRLISHGCSLPTSEQDADLANSPENLDSNRSYHDPYPSRPSSRLGFNLPELPTCRSDGPPDSEASQWSRSLFQNIGIAELRLSSIKPSKMDGAAPVCSLSALNPYSAAQNSACSNGETTIHAAPNNCTRNEPISPTTPRKSPSVSRLCFPFVTTSSPRRNKPPPSPPPTRHKYSCFPSLMCPTPAGRPFPKHQRHDYRQHGYSRTALQNIKWFWSTREENWGGSNAQLRNTKAYDGIAQDNLPAASPLQLPVTLAPAEALAPQSEMDPASVFPRRGDISALRDPYCADIDRSFSGLPIWTINKTLWMHDLHMATQIRAHGPQTTSEDDSSDDNDDGELESLSSAQFSDDSDTTLVESENEADLPDALRSEFTTLDVGAKAKDKTDGLHQNGKVGPSSTVVFANQSPSKRFNAQTVPSRAGWSQSTNNTIIKSKASNQAPQYQWPTNWYGRWEVLVDLSRQDKHRGDIFGDMDVSVPPSAKLNSRPHTHTAGRHDSEPRTVMHEVGPP